jgi:DNA-binding response OmpR family regulator
MRILVVEDDPAAAAVLSKGLREHTYAVDVANGSTALEQGASATTTSSFTFVIDGIDVVTATADRRGRAEVEVDVPVPGTTASR